MPGVIDRYVSPSGSDANPGTPSAPWKTLQKAAGAATAGMTIHVAPGTYNGSLSVSASGSATAPIRFVSDTRWGAKVVGLFQPRGDYITVQDFEVTNPNGSQGIETYGSHTTIRGNKVHDVPGGCPSYGGAGIHSYRDTDNLIENNLVYNIGNNTGVACYLTHGIYLEGAREIVRNNIVLGTQGWGIHMWHGATQDTIVNNTVANNLVGGILVGAGDADATTNDYTTVANNIVYRNGALGGRHGISEDGNTGSHNLYTNNLVTGNANANYNLKNGLQPTATVDADPQFVNYTGTVSGDYRLRATSPAIGAGSAIYIPPRDFKGNALRRGVTAHIGAWGRDSSG